MFHRRAPFANHRHRFQTAGISLRSIPHTHTLALYFYTLNGDQAAATAQKGSFRECGVSLSHFRGICAVSDFFFVFFLFLFPFFFVISRIYFLCRRICILTKGPRKKVINKKHLGTNTRLKAGSNGGRVSCKRRNYSRREETVVILFLTVS